VCASATTPAGFDVLARTRPDLCTRFAPLDHPWCVAAALAQAAPTALVLVETELWPAWIAAAARRGIPVLVVSARLSDRSLPRYRRYAPLLRNTWSRLAAVGARSDRDAERFRSLGVDPARIHVTGDLKFDPPSARAPLASDLEAFIGLSAPWAAVSTHPQEEGAILDAFVAARRENPARRLVLAPRHLGRMAAIERELGSRGLPWTLRSALRWGPSRSEFSPGSVLLIDTLGEVPSLLPKAAFVFVGGTLAPIGGHNVLEPAWAGRAVLFGPHTANMADAAEHLCRSGVATRVGDADALREAVLQAFSHADTTARRGETALQVVSAHSGAAERAAELVAGAVAAVKAKS
jgi:3-deoxy-D-manno-octulosonic-acid transferase